MTQSKAVINKTVFLCCVILNRPVAFLPAGIPTPIQPRVTEHKKNGVPMSCLIQVRR
jgi:hypothetical protein